MLRSHKHFWGSVNDYVTENDPMVPIKCFRHSLQTVYSKTKGVVHGSAQGVSCGRQTIPFNWNKNYGLRYLRLCMQTASLSDL